MHYTDEELELFERDVDKLHGLWLAYINDKVKGELPEHQAPGLIAMCAEIFTQIMHRLHEAEGENLGVALDEQRIGAILANVFDFGQYAAQHGVDRANMTPCGCDIKLTDDDIRNLLGN